MAQKDPPLGVSRGSFCISAQCFEGVRQEFSESCHHDGVTQQLYQHQNEGCKHSFSSLWRIFKPEPKEKITLDLSVDNNVLRVASNVMSPDRESLENLLSEERTFTPSTEFAAQANATADLYDLAEKDRLTFWETQAHNLSWDKAWDTVLEWEAPYAKWFVGGKINASYNALDRHVLEGRGDRVAFHFVGEPGDTQDITYAQMLVQVKKTANALTELGVEAGDRVAIYMPMIPEAAVAMLACARIGAAHSVVFGGFSADALLSRIQDADAKLVITADGGFRKG
jgi:non-ribosomal peptide synthetase component F